MEGIEFTKMIIGTERSAGHALQQYHILGTYQPDTVNLPNARDPTLKMTSGHVNEFATHKKLCKRCKYTEKLTI